MVQELRKLENSKYPCPRCGERTVKVGKRKNTGEQIRRCECNHYFTQKEDIPLTKFQVARKIWDL